MSSSAATEATPLLAAAFLLRLRPIISPSAAAVVHGIRSAAALLAIAAFLAVICAVPAARSQHASDAEALRLEIDDLRLKIARLESILEGDTKSLRTKAYIMEEDNKLTEAMEHDIQLLMNVEETKKSERKSYSESNIFAMEDEVQILQQEVRKINSIAYTIESLANDAEKRVEFLSNEVKKIEDIIAEQWIQIRQFEQAFVLTKMMTSKVHERRLSGNAYYWPGKYTVPKASRFCKAIRRPCPPDIHRPDVFFLGGSISRSCISLPYKQFKILVSSAQRIHHKVQVNLQDVMRSNRYSRGLANEMITFCMAYLLVISPVWIAWFIFSMRFGSKK
ncbi:uncharacterized protein LOC100842654 isoform X3 [Brachypodium distachyon]|uniref:Uncharacterized protein n=1 Tax=Brachypodium distachyon TaxID=15368 RepID=A0A0Q3PYT9_BRADI|nr:uncharacterized protein LOC100842654 isoform X3 [Brachypodium distachyon]KQJ94601.1 hypothetical protein BRADI_3g11414v3 [Brachypodium distachyon]|eukprot:XP_014757027.1 uncharacterized protein LOC100842654 isoform X3 [Brachypodium distachyon]